ncbi:MAG: PAS domain-containing protein [Myxococcus sp.]|nr:PAS domain-containing protein [Myxococcus sp.]
MSFQPVGASLIESLTASGVGLCQVSGAGTLLWMNEPAATLLGVPAGSDAALEPLARARGLRMIRSEQYALLVEDATTGLLELNHAAVEAAANAIMITDARGRIEYVNPAFSRMTGYSREEAVGQSSNLLRSGTHDPAFYEVLWSTISSGATWTGVLTNRKKDGTLYTEESTITPVDGPGLPRHYIAVKRDVSEEQRIASLAERNERLGQVGALAASVAHDLVNMLTPLITGLSFLQEEVTDDQGDLRETLFDMGEGSKRALALVRQMVDFARGGAGLRAPVMTTALLEAHVRQLRRALPPAIDFKAEIAPSLPTLLADALQLYQVLLNLCLNAVDAMNGQGTLTLRAHATEQGVALEVCDTGPGIPPHLAARVFEPFFTTKSAGKGTGLGLATVKRVAEAHGGSVDLVSAPGGGARFTVWLPAYAS